MASINEVVNKEEKTLDEVVNKESKDLKHTIELKGKTFKIELLNGEDGLDLFEYLNKKLLPSVGSGVDGMFGNSGDFLGTTQTFETAFSNFSRNLEGDTMKKVSKNLLQNCTVDGKPLDFAEEFKGEYGVWRQLVMFALKENFGSFFEFDWGEHLGTLATMLMPLQSGSSTSQESSQTEQ